MLQRDFCLNELLDTHTMSHNYNREVWVIACAMGRGRVDKFNVPGSVPPFHVPGSESPSVWCGKALDKERAQLLIVINVFPSLTLPKAGLLINNMY